MTLVAPDGNGKGERIVYNIEFDLKTGGMNVGGVEPNEKLFAAWLFRRAADAISHQFNADDLAVMLGRKAAPGKIAIAHSIDPMTGVRNNRRTR